MAYLVDPGLVSGGQLCASACIYEIVCVVDAVHGSLPRADVGADMGVSNLLSTFRDGVKVNEKPAEQHRVRTQSASAQDPAWFEVSANFLGKYMTLIPATRILGSEGPI